jgi:chorismate mutase
MIRTVVYWSITILALSVVLTGTAMGQIRSRTAQERNEIATLTYSSSAAQASFSRQANSELMQLRSVIDQRDQQIAELRAKLAARSANVGQYKETIAELERLLADAAREKDRFVELLAKQDEDFERERQILLEVGDSLIETPQGTEALRLFNLGGKENWQASKEILAQIASARATAALRSEAVLYSQAVQRGLETTANAILKWEEVARLAPKMTDLSELQELYLNAGMTDRIPALIGKMEVLAGSNLERMNVAQAKGRFASLRGDVQAARVAFADAVSIAERLPEESEGPAGTLLLALARYEYAMAAFQVQDPETARQQIDLALPVFSAAAESYPDNVTVHQEAIRGAIISGAIDLYLQYKDIEGARALGKSPFATAAFSNTIKSARALAARHPDNPYLQGFLQGLVCGTSGMLLDLAPVVAEPFVDECISNSRTTMENDPTSIEARENYILALDRSIQLFAARSEWLKADSAVKKALQVARETHAMNAALPKPRFFLAQALFYKAQIDANLLRRDDVLSALEESGSLLEALIIETPDDIQNLRILTDVLWTAADFSQIVGGVTASGPYLQRGLQVARKRAARSDAIWMDQLALINYVTTMATLGIDGVDPTEAVAELDRMARIGLVAPEGKAEFARLRAAMISLRDSRSGSIQP